MFEFSFRDEHLPHFYGCGAIGTWSIELGSSQVRTIDPTTISDVIWHFKIKACDGGKPLRDAAEESIVKRLNEIINEKGLQGVYWALDVRTEFPMPGMVSSAMGMRT